MDDDETPPPPSWEVERWRRRRDDAGAGDAEAMLQIAEAIRSSDPSEAAAWVRRAAEAGNLVGMHNLAVGLWPDDPEQATNWWRRSAEGGNAAGVYGYAWALDRRGDPAAIGWLRKAAENQCLPAMRALGRRLQASAPEEARRWLQTAVDLGDPEAMVLLAKQLDPLDLGPVRHRVGPLPPNAAGRTRAVMLLEEASARGSPNAALRLATYELQWDPSCLRIPSTRQDQARRLLTRAVELGSISAMWHLSRSLQWHRPEEAHEWLERAASAGDPVARGQLVLSAASRSPKRGAELLQQTDQTVPFRGHRVFWVAARNVIRAGVYFEGRLRGSKRKDLPEGDAHVWSAPRFFRKLALVTEPSHRALRLLCSTIRCNRQRRQGRTANRPTTST